MAPCHTPKKKITNDKPNQHIIQPVSLVPLTMGQEGGC